MFQEAGNTLNSEHHFVLVLCVLEYIVIPLHCNVTWLLPFIHMPVHVLLIYIYACMFLRFQSWLCERTEDVNQLPCHLRKRWKTIKINWRISHGFCRYLDFCRKTSLVVSKFRLVVSKFMWNHHKNTKTHSGAQGNLQKTFSDKISWYRRFGEMMFLYT